MPRINRIRPTLTLAAAVLASAAAAPALAACPEWQIDGVPIVTDAETAWTPQSLALTAGGGLDLAQCTSVQGHGNVTQAPHFTITYDARNMGRDLDFRVESQCDTVMLVNDAAAAWHFNDDADNTLNPRVRLSGAQSGIYDVWVGTYGTSACAATLVVETFPPAGAAPATAGNCPDWSLGGAEIRLTGGDSATRQVVAGGAISLFGNACGIEGNGHVAQAPDFTLYLDAQDTDGVLRIAARGDCDTLLLVNDPMQTWLFNDDHTSLDPMIEVAEPYPGRFDIWVGTYGDALCQATLDVAWILPNAAAPGAPAATK